MVSSDKRSALDWVLVNFVCLLRDGWEAQERRGSGPGSKLGQSVTETHLQQGQRLARYWFNHHIGYTSFNFNFLSFRLIHVLFVFISCNLSVFLILLAVGTVVVVFYSASQ